MAEPPAIADGSPDADTHPLVQFSEPPVQNQMDGLLGRMQPPSLQSFPAPSARCLQASCGLAVAAIGVAGLVGMGLRGGSGIAANMNDVMNKQDDAPPGGRGRGRGRGRAATPGGRGRGRGQGAAPRAAPSIPPQGGGASDAAFDVETIGGQVNLNTNSFKITKLPKFKGEVPADATLNDLVVGAIDESDDLTVIKGEGDVYFDADHAQGTMDWEAFPGFGVSATKGSADAFVRVTYRPFARREENLLDNLHELHRAAHKNFFERAERLLVGRHVMLEGDDMQRVMQIDSIDWDAHPDEAIARKFGMTGNFDPKQPMLKCGDEAVPSQACRVVNIGDRERQNFSLMKVLSQTMAPSPMHMGGMLEGFLAQNQGAINRKLGKLNLQVDRKLLKVVGRHLPPETIYMPGSKFTYRLPDTDWKRDMRGKKMGTVDNLKDWVLVYWCRDKGTAWDFKKTLQRVTAPMGWRVEDPQEVELDKDDARAYLNAIKEHVKPDTQFVVCILPNTRQDRIDAIVRCCVVEKSVPFEYIVNRWLTKRQQLISECTNIGVTMCVKSGGEAWSVEIPIKGLMVIGISEEEAPEGSRICGIVSSTNANLTQYVSRTTASGEKVGGKCLQEAIDEYKKANDAPPKRVVIFVEVPDFSDEAKDAWTSAADEMKQAAENDSELKIAVVLVNRSTSTVLVRSNQGQMANPVAGTVLDNTITSEGEFHMVSASVRQGTIYPTAYKVVSNETILNMDNLQRLVYKLCHLCSPAPATNEVPAPVAYAKKLAEAVGRSVPDGTSKAWRNLPWFLHHEDAKDWLSGRSWAGFDV